MTYTGTSKYCTLLSALRVAAPPSANRSYAAGDIVLSVAPRALPGIASKAVSEAYVLKVHREAILLEAATVSGL